MDLESFRCIQIFETNEVIMFSDTFPDKFRTGKRNDYLDEDIPNEDDTNATPASPIPSQPSRSSSSSPGAAQLALFFAW